MKIPPLLANIIVGTVTLVWAGNFLAGIFLPGYQSDPSLNFVFMTIVGGALALRGGDENGAPGLFGRLVGALRAPHPPHQPADRSTGASPPTREDRP